MPCLGGGPAALLVLTASLHTPCFCSLHFAHVLQVRFGQDPPHIAVRTGFCLSPCKNLPLAVGVMLLGEILLP